MPESIVDDLEEIEIKKQQGHPLVLALGPRDGERKPIAEEVTVGQARKRIVLCKIIHPLLRLLAPGDVFDNANEVKRLAGVVARQRYGAVDPQHAAVFADIPHLAE